MTYEQLWHRLTHIYEAGEAKAIVRMVLEVRFGLSLTDILCGQLDNMPEQEQQELEAMMQRLEKGEPVQYVTGLADFCGRQFHVEPGVLIPRPETEELCRWVIGRTKGLSPCEVFDIGTGSGCIAITLALELPDAKVTAWDISDAALRIASENTTRLGAHVTFEHHDILSMSHSTLRTPHSTKFDLIVSNPPYICTKEADEMAINVLDYEPHEALFVPDEDPLLFYRAIAQYAMTALKPQGYLFFEINALYASALCDLLSTMSFCDIEIHPDQFGKPRFLKATKI